MKFFLIVPIALLLAACNDNSFHQKLVTKDKLKSFVPIERGENYIPYDTTERTNILEIWASDVLFDLQEPILYQYVGSADFIRLVWLKSFENPIVIRVNKFSDTLYANIKELKIKKNKTEISNVIKDTIIPIDQSTWVYFTNPLQNFFRVSSYADTSFNHSSDGAVWFLECRLHGQYKIIRRWDDGYLTSPELNNYLNPLISFANKYVDLKSVR